MFDEKKIFFGPADAEEEKPLEKNTIENDESDMERHELIEKITVAEQALIGYAKFKPGDKVLFLVDEQFADPETVKILKKAAENLGADSEEIVINSGTNMEDIQKKLCEGMVVLKFAKTSGLLKNILDDDLEDYKFKCLNLMDLGSDVFSKDGAISEDAETLGHRLNKMENELEKAVGFRIKSVYGTDLKVGLRLFKERKWFKESGVLENGKWGNLPSCEIFTTPDENNVNGVLVLPSLDSEISDAQGVDDFVKITIRDGVITSIEGGDSASKLRVHLEKDMKNEKEDGGNPLNVLRIAEFAFGANSKARDRVASPEGDYSQKGISTVEAEKRLGTIHLAFGDSKHGEEGSEGFEGAGSHYDFVIPRAGLTVEMYTDESDFKNSRNGRRVISDGGFNLI